MRSWLHCIILINDVINLSSVIVRRMSEPAKAVGGGGGLPVIVPEASHQTHLERVLSPPKPYNTRMPWLSERSLPTVDAAPRYTSRAQDSAHV